jgi:4-aminobutyrate aminotransferase
MDAKEYLKTHLTRAWGFTTDITVERAEGIYLYAKDGRKFTDFTSGHAVMNIGYSHPKVVEAVKVQAEKFFHAGSIFYYDSLASLAERLSGITPPGMDRFFFSNSGSEAVEGAIKLARYKTGRKVLISFNGAFHGRTMGALSLTSSSSHYRTRYEPLLPSVYQVDYPYCFRRPCGEDKETCELSCIGEIERLFARIVSPKDVAAFIIEPVLGEGGYVPAPEGFLRALREICDLHGILLIFDEVQSGMGRTCKWFALEHYSVIPDIITAAKGIASGLPLSAIISRADLMDGWETGAHGTTFGGNPIACAAASATIDAVKEEHILEKAEKLSRGVYSRLFALQEKIDLIGDVRGLGYMIGIEFMRKGEPDRSAVEKMKQECFKKGLIIFDAGTQKNVVRFAPPLITSPEEMDEALHIFEEAALTL